MTTRTRRFLAYTAAALAGIVGVGSLSLFGLFLWTGAFGLVDMGMAQHSLLGWDAGLCLLFFFQHSVMVRKSVRAWLNRVVPAYCYGVGKAASYTGVMR